MTTENQNDQNNRLTVALRPTQGGPQATNQPPAAPNLGDTGTFPGLSTSEQNPGHSAGEARSANQRPTASNQPPKTPTATPANGETEAPPTLGKRNRGHSQIEPMPAGGIRYNYVTGQVVGPKKMRMTEKEAGAPALDNDGDRNIPPSSEERRKQLQLEKAASEATFQAFLRKYAGDTQLKETGAIRWIQQHHPRYTDSQSWVRMAVEFQPTREALLKQYNAQTENWLWIQVYKNQTPDAEHVESFVKAMKKIEAWKSEPDFLADDYNPMLIKKKNGNTAAAVLVICEGEEAKMRLLRLGSFAYAADGKETAFFIQGPTSCGNHLVLEFYNAPASEEHLIKGAFRALEEVVLWKEDSEEKCVAAGFRFAKLGVDGRGTRWLVAVKPNLEILAKGWKYPEHAGDYGATGEIQIKKPEWCKHCVSWSHEERYCEWWREGTVTSTAVPPPNYVQLQWKDHTTFTFTKEKVGEGIERVTVGTAKATHHPSLPEPLYGKARGSGRGGFRGNARGSGPIPTRGRGRGHT